MCLVDTDSERKITRLWNLFKKLAVQLIYIIAVLVVCRYRGKNESTSFFLHTGNWGTEGIAEVNSQSIWTYNFLIKQFHFKVERIFSFLWLGGNCVLISKKKVLKICVQAYQHPSLKCFRILKIHLDLNFLILLVTCFWQIIVVMIPWVHCRIIHTPESRARVKHWTVFTSLFFSSLNIH